jgi:hypothetical protein
LAVAVLPGVEQAIVEAGLKVEETAFQQCRAIKQ